MLEDFLLQPLQFHLNRLGEFIVYVHDLRKYVSFATIFGLCTNNEVDKSIQNLIKLNLIKGNRLSDTCYYFYK